MVNYGTRDLIYQLGSELAGIIEEASVSAATLPDLPNDALTAVIAAIKGATGRRQAIAAAMRD